MADYYTNFSLVLELPDQSAQEYALKVAQEAADMRFGEDPPELPPDFPASLVDVLEIWLFETEAQGSLEQDKYGIWLHSSDGGIDAVCAFIQHLLRKFNPAGCVEFEWSNDCSKPRTDAYGGGAAIITARKIKSMTTYEWLQKQTAARGRQHQPKGETNESFHDHHDTNQRHRRAQGACGEMGIQGPRKHQARGYSTNTTQGDYVLRLKGPYDVALNKQPDGSYGLTTDWWDGHVEKEVGTNYGRLLQLYAVHKATSEARRRGHTVQRKAAEERRHQTRDRRCVSYEQTHHRSHSGANRRHHNRSRRLQGSRLREGHQIPGGSLGSRRATHQEARVLPAQPAAASTEVGIVKAVLTFKPDGMVMGIYTEAIPLGAIGALKINRLTEIEFNDSTQEWEVGSRTGTVLFSHQSRQSCLDWEHREFNR